MDTLQALELFAAVVLVLATTLLFRHLRRRLDAPPRTNSLSPPRPRGLPLIGNLHQLGRLPHASLAALAAEHAAPLMELRLGTVPALVVSTADAARPVFQPNDRALSGRPARQRAAARLSYGLQDITFSAPDSPLWRAARRACLSELLGAPRVRAFRDAREAQAAVLVADISAAAGAGSHPVNLSEKLSSASNRIVMRVAFGDYADEETTAVLEDAQKHFGAFFVSDYVPWLGWVDALRGLRRELERYFHELDAFYERLIHAHQSKQAEGSSSSSKDEEEEDLVDVLLRLLQDPAHKNAFGNRGAVKGILMDIFLAGTETSAAALEWTMTELINHPDILRETQSEVRGAVDGGKEDMVQEADLPRLRYLKAVIRESLRLHPPAPLLVPRETTEPCTVRGGGNGGGGGYDGYEIPAGTRVLVNAKAIGTDPAAWGADAARFVPERHLGEGVDLGDHKPWHDGGGFALVPFGMGRRSCPGVHFATAVVELLLANLLFCFDWRAPPGGEVVDVDEKPGLVVSRKNPWQRAQFLRVYDIETRTRRFKPVPAPPPVTREKCARCHLCSCL